MEPLESEDQSLKSRAPQFIQKISGDTSCFYLNLIDHYCYTSLGAHQVFFFFFLISSLFLFNIRTVETSSCYNLLTEYFQYSWAPCFLRLTQFPPGHLFYLSPSPYMFHVCFSSFTLLEDILLFNTLRGYLELLSAFFIRNLQSDSCLGDREFLPEKATGILFFFCTCMLPGDENRRALNFKNVYHQCCQIRL